MKQEFYIDYFEKASDPRYPGEEEYPHFQLANGDVGGTMWAGGDPHEEPSPSYHVISTPKDFPALALDMLRFLREPTSLIHTYQTRFSGSASVKIGKTGKHVLEEVLALHNDLVTPKRTRLEFCRKP